MPADVRRRSLRDYIVACIADHVFSIKDIADVPRFLTEVLPNALSADVKEVLRDVGRQGVQVGLGMVAARIMAIATGMEKKT